MAMSKDTQIINLNTQVGLLTEQLDAVITSKRFQGAAYRNVIADLRAQLRGEAPVAAKSYRVTDDERAERRAKMDADRAAAMKA